MIIPLRISAGRGLGAVHGKLHKYFMRPHSMKVKWPERKLAIEPFWKLKAVLNNVALQLKPNVEEVYSIQHSDCFRNLRVDYDGDNKEALVTLNSKEYSDLVLSIPFKVDLDIVLSGDGNATISDVENEAIRVEADSYNLELGSLKSNFLDVETRCGDISCTGTLRGGIKLTSHKGNITAKKLQGVGIDLTAEDGFVQGGDVYAQDLNVNAERGAEFKSVHGSTIVRSTSDIVMGTAEGELDVTSQSGNISTYLADNCQQAVIVSQDGSIDLTLSHGLACKVNAEAKHIDSEVAGDISSDNANEIALMKACLNGGSSPITVQAHNGQLTVRAGSWLEAVSKFNERKSR